MGLIEKIFFRKKYNTKIRYRRKDQYGKVTEIIVVAKYEAKISDRISLAGLMDDLNFVPGQVGLPGRNQNGEEDMKACWFYMNPVSDMEPTMDEPTIGLDIYDIMENFYNEVGEWRGEGDRQDFS